MIFVNEASAQGGVSIDALNRFIRLLAPFAPHICEEMGQALGEKGLVLNAPWPAYDPDQTIEKESTIVVQVNGKLRARIVCPSGIDEASVKAAALDHEDIRNRIHGKQVVRMIYVPDRILNLVVK